MQLTHVNPQAVNEHLAEDDADARSATSVVLDIPALTVAPIRPGRVCSLHPAGSLHPTTHTMADHQNGDWHNANGHGLAFRPPTVDEALPLSPFTSVVPFAPGQSLTFTCRLAPCSLKYQTSKLTSDRDYSFPSR
jgi:hypothetical protein